MWHEVEIILMQTTNYYQEVNITWCLHVARPFHPAVSALSYSSLTKVELSCDFVIPGALGSEWHSDFHFVHY